MQVRVLNKKEFEYLLQMAPESETRNLWKFAALKNVSPYEYLFQNSVVSSGIVNGRPLYAAYLIPNGNIYELWTIVNSNVKEQLSLFKISKRTLRDWGTIFNPIYATMEKSNQKNLQWTRRLGFKKVNEDAKTITLKLEV